MKFRDLIRHLLKTVANYYAKAEITAFMSTEKRANQPLSRAIVK